MGQSSRSSSTLKKTFQTFKSFTPIHRTTRTGRMKCLLPILIISLAALCSATTNVHSRLALGGGRLSGDVNEAKEEVKRARAKYAEMQKELMSLRAQNGACNERVAGLEAEMAGQQAGSALAIEERDGIINGLRASLAEYVIELKALTDLKLALDAEIATYRRLLAGEETRFAQAVL